MIEYKPTEPLFRHHREILERGREIFRTEEILDEVARWASIPRTASGPGSETDDELDGILFAFAVLVQVPGTEHHRRASTRFRALLKREDEILARAHHAFRATPPTALYYEVNVEDGWHEIRLVDGESTTGDALVWVDSGEEAERDRDYCCERCNGPYVATPAERRAAGTHVGWTFESQVLSLRPIEPWVFESFWESIPHDRPPPPRRCLRAAAAPWLL